MSDLTNGFRAVWESLSEEDQRFLMRLGFPSVRVVMQLTLLFERGHCPTHTCREVPGVNARRIEFLAWEYRKGRRAEWK